MVHKDNEKYLFIGLILFSCLLIGLDKLNFLNWLKRPIEKASVQIRKNLKQFTHAINNQQLIISNNLSQNAIDKQKITNLELDNAKLKIDIINLTKENLAMKKLLGAPLPPQWKFIPAKVLSINNGIITLASGLDAGVLEKQIVIANNHLIGQVIRSTPGQARVVSLTSKDFQVRAKILMTNARGIVKASVNNIITLDEVLQEIPLGQEQIIVSSGEDGVFPADLIIGKISSIEPNPTAVYQKAIIKPLINLEDLEEVFIIQNYP